jgi:Peptidase family M48
MLKRATLSLMLGVTISALGQTRPANLKPGSVEAKALAFFEQIEERSFEDYLRRVRLPKVSQAVKAEVLARITKGEEVRMSDRMKSKLAAIVPALKFHDRDTIVDVKVLSLPHAFVGLQGRAVLLISDPALNILSTEELQAVVAHELGHEYFWGELTEARQQKALETMREIELRCDGIAAIALVQLGIDPARIVSAVSRMRDFNARIVSTDPLYHPTNNERSRFIQAMIELARSRDGAETMAARR